MSYCGRMVLAALFYPVLILVTLALIAGLIVHCVRRPDTGESDAEEATPHVVGVA